MNARNKNNVRYRDLTGERFGLLVVLRRVGSNKWGSAQWECQCDCGGIAPRVRTNHLTALTGGTKSCGCLTGSNGRNGERRTIVGDWKRYPRHYGKVMEDYFRGAEKRGLEWSITFDEMFVLMSGNCHYCGSPPTRTAKKVQTPYNGLDRVDPTKGYVEGNCVSCCWNCNEMKKARSYNEFIQHIKKISEHLFSHS